MTNGDQNSVVLRRLAAVAALLSVVSGPAALRRRAAARAERPAAARAEPRAAARAGSRLAPATAQAKDCSSEDSDSHIHDSAMSRVSGWFFVPPATERFEQ